MSEAKHTPGSWTATRIISTTCGFIVSDSRGSVVARAQKIGVPKDGNFELPCEENANLIAAAPDLLEALAWMVKNDDTNEGDTPIEKFGGASWNEVNAHWIAGLNKARAAIAKATGGSA